MNTFCWKALLLCTAAMLVLAGCSGTATIHSPTPGNSLVSPTTTLLPPANSASSVQPTQPFPAKPTGKLSARLAKLVETPALFSASPEEQAQALSLPVQGPGSLMHDAQGRLLVNIRLSDLSAAQLQALQDAGCVNTKVEEAYHTATAYVAIADLSSVSNLPAVQSITEELMPAAGGGSLLPTPG